VIGRYCMEQFSGFPIDRITEFLDVLILLKECY
jgi:hypothetical protein